MKRFMLGLAVLAGCAVLGAGAVFAEGRTSKESFPLPDIQADVPRFVSIIEAFGMGPGHLETTLGLIEAELPAPFVPAAGPQEDDARARWKQAFSPLAALDAKFESVDFVGCQSISTAARTLVFIGHGHGGPIQFRFRVFRYQDKWKISNLSYQGSWDQIEADTNFTRFENPVAYPLGTQPVAQTDD